MTKSYISGSGVHWRIKGRRSCGATTCGDECKGGECFWGENIFIHKNVGVNKNITKGNGDLDAWVKCCNKKKMHHHG